MSDMENPVSGNWFKNIEDDLIQVENLMDIYDPEGAGFFLQQAINKFLTAFSKSRGWEEERANNLETILNRAYLPLQHDISKGFTLNEIVYDKSGKAIDFIIIDVNNSFEPLTGITKQKAIKSKASNTYGKGELFKQILSIAVSQKPASFKEYSPSNKKYLDITVFSLKNGQFTTAFSNVSNQKITSKNKITKTNFRDFLNAASAAIFIYNINKESIIDYNKRMCEIFDYSSEDMQKLSLEDILIDNCNCSKEEADSIMDDIDTSGQKNIEITVKNRSGQKYWLELNLQQTSIQDNNYIIGIIHDIKKRKSLEEQLLQSQKMEAMGRLASGIAHDFNNLLTVISGQADLTTEHYYDHQVLCSNMDEIKKATKKATQLTEQLLTFSRRRLPDAKQVNLNSIISNIDKMIRHILGNKIDLVLNLNPSLDKIEINPGLVDQIIINLIVNARDAMPESGKLVISTKNIDIDRDTSKFISESYPGRFVVLSITDTGIGMDSLITKHIFEPFFSTKSPQKGTGLGLSVIYGIVKQQNGWINVYSEPQRGSTFKIYLPSVSKNTEKEINEQQANYSFITP